MLLPVFLINENIKRIILTSGKVYYELKKYRDDNKIKDSAIIRIEQYYPLPKNELVELISSYKKFDKIVWMQEEPANMGAMQFMKIRLNDLFAGKKVEYVSRKSSPSPAPGSYKIWTETQKQIIEKAFSV